MYEVDVRVLVDTLSNHTRGYVCGKCRAVIAESVAVTLVKIHP